MTATQRNEVIARMAAQGIACNVHYKPLPMHSAYRQLGFSINDFPNAYAQFVNEITLPLHTRLNNDHVDYIIENFISILGETI
jgi:dTDP-4-amino-4,6-dideoxygalactose transaminase